MTRTVPTRPLTFDELHQRLETLVYMVLSVRRSVRGPAQELARWPRTVQERFLGSVEMIARSSVELAYNFCAFAPPALALLRDEEAWIEWVMHVTDQYDEGGTRAAIVAMQKVDDYAEYARRSRAGWTLEEAAGVLERFARGLSGRALHLAASDDVYTDTETLHLPPVLSQFPAREENFQLYKAMVVHQWAQTWFGTWRVSLVEATARFADPQRAVRRFHALETLRLDACIARALPGAHREMQALRARAGERELSGMWAEAVRQLSLQGATVHDSHALLARAYEAPEGPRPACYQGELHPQRTEQVMALRLARDRDSLRVALRELLQEHGKREEAVRDEQEHLTLLQVPDPDMPHNMAVRLQLDGELISPPAEVQQVLDSIVQDVGYVPEDYLEAAGQGAYRAAAGRSPEEGSPPLRDEDAWHYEEWDYVRKRYRKDWCVLRERDVHPQWDDFVERTLIKHQGIVRHLRRTFEALRGEDRHLKRQPHGDDIDLDAVIESYGDQAAGLEGSQRLFTRNSRIERNIAVMFMVDMSGSTKGWINDMEREALVLLCRSLEILGDRYAIYGFTSYTHKRCEMLRVKRFDEPYSAEVRARISGITPQDYTRLGVAIRHLTSVLGEVDARTKLLITLSDGRPDDLDGYRGTYGIEDTRQALLEARFKGIHPFCITIDDEAMDYLPHMYGPAGFTVVSKVDALPYRVSDVYRRITR